jgi:hypothetical protein
MLAVYHFYICVDPMCIFFVEILDGEFEVVRNAAFDLFD